MNILFDTNVILDLLLKREPYDAHARDLFIKIEKREITGYLCSTTVTTVYYFVAKLLDRMQAEDSMKQLLQIFEVASVDRTTLEVALSVGFIDFEDAVLYASGSLNKVDGIVTRNPKDFKKSLITVYAPDELLAALH